MIDFEADFNSCIDNDWFDLQKKYWNIMATAKGDVRHNALLSLRDEVTAKVLALPPSEEEVMAHSPTMSND